MTEEEFLKLAKDLRKNHAQTWARRVRNMHEFVFCEKMPDDAIPLRYLANVLNSPERADGRKFPEVPEEKELHRSLKDWGYRCVVFTDSRENEEHEQLWDRYITAYRGLSGIKGRNNPDGRERYRKQSVFWVADIQVSGADTCTPEEASAEPGFDGALRQVTTNRYERDPKLRRACIDFYKNKDEGQLKCQVCGLDFSRYYGPIGLGFIHVHHRNPLGEKQQAHSVDPQKDLVPVCPNCHAMLHKKPGAGAYRLEELREMIAQNRR